MNSYKETMLTMRKVISNLFSLIMLLIFVNGCATYQLNTSGTKMSDEEIKKIVPGTTTRDEIVKIFGEPSSVQIHEDGSEELIYEYKETKTPFYLGGLIVDEKRKKESSTMLKVFVRKNVVESYHFKKKEER